MVAGGTWLAASAFNPKRVEQCASPPLSAEVKDYINGQANKSSDGQCSDLPKAVKKVADLEIKVAQMELVRSNAEPIIKGMPIAAPGGLARPGITAGQPSVVPLINRILNIEALVVRSRLSFNCPTADWSPRNVENFLRKSQKSSVLKNESPQKGSPDDD